MIATRCPNRSDHRDPAEVSLSFMIVNLIIIETVLVVVAQLMLRHGAIKLDMPSLGIGIVAEAVQNVWIMSGLALHGISFFLYVFILSKLKLSVFYPFPNVFSTARVLTCLALLLALTVAALRTARSRPYLLVGWLWFLGTLVPVIGLVQVGMQARADRTPNEPRWRFGGRNVFWAGCAERVDPQRSP